MLSREDQKSIQTEMLMRVEVKKFGRLIAKNETQISQIDKQVPKLLKAGKMEEARQKAMHREMLQTTNMQYQKMRSGLEMDLASLQTDKAYSQINRNTEASLRFQNRTSASKAAESQLKFTELATQLHEERMVRNMVYKNAEDARASTMANEDNVDEYLAKMADSVDVSVGTELRKDEASKIDPGTKSVATEPTPDVEETLSTRLRVLRAT